MRGLSQSVIANEEHLVQIYRRTGDTQFTYSDIADLIPRGVMLRYTVPGIFMPARDCGKIFRTEEGAFIHQARNCSQENVRQRRLS